MLVRYCVLAIVENSKARRVSSKSVPHLMDYRSRDVVVVWSSESARLRRQPRR